MAIDPGNAPSRRESERAAPGAPGLYLAVAGLLTLAYFGAVLLATGAPGPALRATVIAVVPGVGLAFVVLRIGRRARWFEGRGARLAAVHAPLCAGYSAAWALTTVALVAVERWLFVAGSPFQIRLEVLGFTLFTGVLLYGGIAGAAFGLESSARLRDERARAARAETLRVRAELAALRAQLNPHFLFNTLHTVLGLVRRDPALAEEALQDLGDVLRYALDVQRGDDRVTLRDELAFVDRYLAIERVRLGDRLRVEREVEGAALDSRLPAFTVQPVVENAIRYAVACRAQGGRVRIEARIDARDARTGSPTEPGAEPRDRAHSDSDARTLRMTISDDGAGAPPTPSGAGLGLALVRQRLEAAFGTSAELLAEKTDTGFVVTLRVPQPAGDAA
ncbi:MAG TPA: histidine kinase [Kofleriaceae bacterium]|nr:histidine kinase [Kofleriaceae bacterium]